MDDNNDNALTYGEFQKAMIECGLKLESIDLHALFAYFDKDSSGDIDFEEFLQGVKVSFKVYVFFIIEIFVYIHTYSVYDLSVI